MNNELINIIKKRNIHPIGYKRIKNVYLIHDHDKDYIIKLNTNNCDIYKYLTSREFSFFPKNITNHEDNYDISVFVDGLIIDKEQKLSDFIKLIATLHYKTSYKREIDLDEIKEKYESLSSKIIYLKKYYLEINDKINHELFLSPSEYLLVRNISLIYRTLDIINELLDEVYHKVKNKKSIRVGLLHNNPDLDHLIVNEKEYLISWDKSYFDSPIIEIEKIYRKYYQYITLNDLLKIYENINKLNNIEKDLLLIVLAIPKKIEFIENEYINTNNINTEINYLKDVYEVLSLNKK